MATRTITGDWESYQLGDLAVWNNVWNKGNFVSGKDYTQKITFNPEDLTQGVVFSWNWPAGPSSAVVSYPEIVVGYKPWGQLGSTDLSCKVDDITNYTVNYNLYQASSGANNNIAFEFWLTDKEFGTETSITTEVMIWVHHGKMTPPGEVVGTYQSGSHSAQIYSAKNFTTDVTDVNWNYVALNFSKDFLKGSLDFKDIMQVLEKKGLISGDNYIGGFELGAEVNGGRGGFKINSLDYDIREGDPRSATIKVTQGDDNVRGTAHADEISGRAGDDKILGLKGDDTLSGEHGRDRLIGGAGHDEFVFRYTGKSDADTVVDFQSGADTINLDHRGFSGLHAGDNVADTFALAGHEGTETRLVFDTENGNLYFDANGSEKGGRALVAHFDSAHLQAGDILVF